MFSSFCYHLFLSAVCASDFKPQAAFGLVIYTPPPSQDLLEMAITAHKKPCHLLNPWILSAPAELPDVLSHILLLFLIPTLLYLS